MTPRGLAACWGLTPDGIGAAVVAVEAHVARGLPSLGARWPWNGRVMCSAFAASAHSGGRYKAASSERSPSFADVSDLISELRVRSRVCVYL